jgi:phosphoglycerol transferase MdoB-like AlkP superfamily enzyme
MGGKMSSFFAAIGIAMVAVPLILIMVILALMWRAWWLYPAWAWFIVPLGLPAITFWHFAALVFLVNLLMHQMSTKKDERKEDWPVLIMAFLWPALAWALMWWMWEMFR